MLRDVNSGSSKGTTNNIRQRSAYRVPRGGLFDSVATPHYLFELLTWIGIATYARSWAVLLLVLMMAAYLFDRSAAQEQYNRTKIRGYPANRARMIPFVF